MWGSKLHAFVTVETGVYQFVHSIWKRDAKTYSKPSLLMTFHGFPHLRTIPISQRWLVISQYPNIPRSPHHIVGLLVRRPITLVCHIISQYYPVIFPLCIPRKLLESCVLLPSHGFVLLFLEKQPEKQIYGNIWYNIQYTDTHLYIVYFTKSSCSVATCWVDGGG